MTEFQGIAVLYARVSTDENDKDQRTETQVEQMKAYCAQNGYEIVGIYSEHGSAGDLDRHEWDAMMGRIMRGGVTYLIARDESRITRSTEDMATVTRLLSAFGTVIRYVNSSARPEEATGKLINVVNTWQAEVERKKLKANTSAGMQQRKREGNHMGKPLAFAFEEDLPLMDATMRGRVNTDPSRSSKGKVTKIYREDDIFMFARQGRSLTYVAEHVVGVSHSVLIAGMKKREDEPRVRFNKYGDKIYYYRYTGLKDRYTVYMTLYDESISRRKGVPSERVGFGPENPSERVVS